jgi:hypothetical protein
MLMTGNGKCKSHNIYMCVKVFLVSIQTKFIIGKGGKDCLQKEKALFAVCLKIQRLTRSAFFHSEYIVTYRSIARQRLYKHVPSGTDTW